MKKLISIVLIFTCLCLGACSRSSLNPAFFHIDSFNELIEENCCSRNDASQALIDRSPDGKISDVSVDEVLEITNHRLLYWKYNECCIECDDAIYEVVNQAQGLYMVIGVCEDFELRDDYKDYKEYIERTAIYGNYGHSGTAYPTITISRNEVMCYEIISIGKWSYYNVYLGCYDRASGTSVRIHYKLPTADNEEQIQYLRNWGIPVVTDYT